MLYEPIKRLMDILISVPALILGIPLVIILGILIKLEGYGGIFYSQPRVGRNRKFFNLHKFRSMVHNADEILYDDPKFLEKLRSGTHKLENDPRITKIGKIIRKFSIDEFPQFVNVLKSEMSFVGPRAYRPDELKKYEEENPQAKDDIEALLSVKPGITGLWQVSGRSKVSFDDRIRLEAEYARRRSLFLDLYIILKTPFVVLKGEGAA